MTKKKALIIGAGPAGLTAAYELLQRTDIDVIVLEKSSYMGGISRTVNYKGNRIDIGGHRFFSKSDRVMQWWQNILPIQTLQAGEHTICYQGKSRTISANSSISLDPKNHDNVMLLRKRKSRIYFNRTFFDYPLKINIDTIRKLGFVKTFKMGLSYIRSTMHPIKPEKTLEDLFINRFGKLLYETFFKSYTEKVWGVPCHKISTEWGAQRIKGFSITKAIFHSIKQLFVRRKKNVAQKETETTLIEQFLYPKYGPGQMWEEVANQVKKFGGTIRTTMEVKKIYATKHRIISLEVCNAETGKSELLEGDYVFSTMAIQDLVQVLQCSVPDRVKKVSDGLQYRDFITVGLLLKKLKVSKKTSTIEDNWIYIQEPDVSVGRMQIFNNWSPYMVADPTKIWIGLEYFCYKNDNIWNLTDNEMIEFAKHEMDKIDIINKNDVLDAVVIRMEKTYPAYFGSYKHFDVVREYLDNFENLFLIGRNGMHKYNNQDHSMLTAMTAVDNIVNNHTNKANIWAVNVEQEYHEQKSSL